VVQGKINRGRHTDQPAGRHSIRTNQCPPLPSPIFFTGRMPFLPPNHQRQSTEGTQKKHNYNGIYLCICFLLRFCPRKRVQKDTKQIATVVAGTVYPRTLSFGTMCALVAMRPRFCSTSGVKDECQPSCRPLEMQHVMPNGFIFSLDLSHV